MSEESSSVMPHTPQGSLVVGTESHSGKYWENLAKLSEIMVESRQYNRSMEAKFDNRMNTFAEMMMKAGQMLVESKEKASRAVVSIFTFNACFNRSCRVLSLCG